MKKSIFSLTTILVIVFIIALLGVSATGFSQCVSIGTSNTSGATINSIRARQSVTGNIVVFANSGGGVYTAPNTAGNNWFIEVRMTGNFQSLTLTYPLTPPWSPLFYPTSAGTAWYLTFDGPVPMNSCQSYKLYIN